MERLVDRPGRSLIVPLPHFAPPRVVSHITHGSPDLAASSSTSTQVRIVVRLNLSHRVLTYFRHRVWGCSLANSAQKLSREVVDVSAGRACAWLPRSLL